MQKPKNFSGYLAQSARKPLVIGNQRSAERAVLKTLSYRAIFNYPISFAQLQNFLITKKQISRAELSLAVESLLSKNKIKKAGAGYCLVKVEPVEASERAANSLKLIEKAREISGTLAKIPWIKFIGVTGSVAAFNAVEKDDIDMLIITERKRLWLTRGFVFIVLKILGELRKDSAPDRKICPNILIDETGLAWSRRSRNIYVAHEIALTHPVFDRDSAYLRFLQANSWILKYFGNLRFWQGEIRGSRKFHRNILDIFEFIAQKLQLNYMSSKRTTEVTKDNVIHFNREDHTKTFLNEFEKIKSKELR